jgi:hypothetical protein
MLMENAADHNVVAIEHTGERSCLPRRCLHFFCGAVCVVCVCCDAILTSAHVMKAEVRCQSLYYSYGPDQTPAGQPRVNQVRSIKKTIKLLAQLFLFLRAGVHLPRPEEAQECDRSSAVDVDLFHMEHYTKELSLAHRPHQPAQQQGYLVYSLHIRTVRQSS